MKTTQNSNWENYLDTKVVDAIHEINQLCSDGYEFPDACFIVQLTSKIPADLLKSAYDSQF